MGMRRNPANGRHATQIRLPGPMLDRLDAEAEARMLGRSRLIELLLADALDRLAPVTIEDGDDG